MPQEDTDVPHFCSEPFSSCLDFAQSLRNKEEGDPDLVMFMTKAHYGTASLTHFSSYGDRHYYIAEQYPEFLWRQITGKGRFPQPMEFNTRAVMTDRFWEVVIEHTAAADEARKEAEIQRELRRKGLLPK